MIRSNLPASFFSASASPVATTWCAPNARAASSFEALVVNAVTSQPQARQNFSAMWPRPPIPTTPTRAVGEMPSSRSGANTVMPPHSSGPHSAASRPSGSGTTQTQCARTFSAKAPWRPARVGCSSRHRCWLPARQGSQCRQLCAFQPRPTRWPITTPLAFAPSAVTRPTAS